MTRVVREALDKLEDVLLLGGQDGQDLADILSALRGPDLNLNDDFKMRTTGPLRSMVFPRLAEARINEFPKESGGGKLEGYFPIGAACWGMKPEATFDLRFTDGTNHFTKHISRAIEAIKRT